VQGLKPLLDHKLPNPVPYTQAALAATEIARVQEALGQSDAAWESILTGLRLLHGITLSKSSIDERTNQLEKQSGKVREELARVMGLKNDDEKRQAFSQYREKLNDVALATTDAFRWQVVVLETATDLGLLDRVWNQLQTLDRKPSVHEREPLLSTALPLLVAARFAAAGNQKKSAEIMRAVENRFDPADPQVVKQFSENQFNAGDYADCLQRLNDGMNSTGVLHESTLRLACRLVVSGNIPRAVEFCSGLRDPALRDDGLFLTAALAARLGKGTEFWKASAGLVQVDSAAACAGLVVGLKSPSYP
jgi:hypothetical protein